MLRSADVTTPLPSDMTDYGLPKGPSSATVVSFQDAQVRLAVITQNMLSKIYTERRVSRTWTQIQQTMSSLMSDLDGWASGALPKRSDSSQSSPIYDKYTTILKNQYLRVKTSITRPALRRVEHCTPFDHPDAFTLEAAETCIRTAQDVAALFPEHVHLQLAYENGPWWSIVPNSKPQPTTHRHCYTNSDPVMQALAILLIGLSCAPYFASTQSTSIASITKLVTYLRCMRQRDDLARRAYQVLCGIVRTDGAGWGDIEALFPDDDAGVDAGKAPDGYVPWVDEGQAGMWPREGEFAWGV
jgi:hypothetical protein